MYRMLDPATLTVFVTGATSGFGHATAKRFAAAGAKVIAGGRRGDRLDDLQAECGGSVHTVTIDVRDREAVQASVQALPAEFAAVDVVVANAGLALGLEPAQRADLRDWETMVDTNITGLLYTVRALLPGMVERQRGHVITIGSVAGDFPYPGGNAYAATKAFVKQFALGLRADLPGTGVRVTNIEPGLAETEFSVVRFKGDSKQADRLYENTVALSGADIAESIFWAATLPHHVNINRIQLMPISQSFGPMAIRRD